MRYLIAWIVTAALAGSALVSAQDKRQDKRPPEKLVLRNPGGDVIFTHAAHIGREKGQCTACHESLWPQSAAEPLKNSDGCKTCHRVGGKAFEMKNHCVQCHPGGGGKAG